MIVFCDCDAGMERQVPCRHSPSYSPPMIFRFHLATFAITMIAPLFEVKAMRSIALGYFQKNCSRWFGLCRASACGGLTGAFIWVRAFKAGASAFAVLRPDKSTGPTNGKYGYSFIEAAPVAELDRMDVAP